MVQEQTKTHFKLLESPTIDSSGDKTKNWTYKELNF